MTDDLSPDQDWRPIPDYPNYEINALGAIRTTARQLVVQQTQDHNGQWYVKLISPDRKRHRLRRTSYLVAMTFHSENKPENADDYTRAKLYVIHRDNDLTNVRADNVDWYTAQGPDDVPEPDDEPNGYEESYPEVWRIYGGNPHYLVSNYGRVRSRGLRHLMLKQYTSAKGDPVVVLRRTENDKTTTRKVNQLVAETFVPRDMTPRAYRPRNKDEPLDSVWHIDGDVTNCRADNLLWDTRSRVIEWNRQNSEGFDLKTHREDGTEYSRHRKVMENGNVYRSMEELAKEEGILLSDVKYVYYSLAEYVGDPNVPFSVV